MRTSAGQMTEQSLLQRVEPRVTGDEELIEDRPKIGGILKRTGFGDPAALIAHARIGCVEEESGFGDWAEHTGRYRAKPRRVPFDTGLRASSPSFACSLQSSGKAAQRG